MCREKHLFEPKSKDVFFFFFFFSFFLTLSISAQKSFPAARGVNRSLKAFFPSETLGLRCLTIPSYNCLSLVPRSFDTGLESGPRITRR